MAKKKALAHVMLKPGLTGTFQRTVRDKKDPDKVVDRLRFAPGQPVAIESKEWIERLCNDIGNALVIVELNEFGQPKIDVESTQAVVDERNGVSAEIQVDKPEQNSDGQSQSQDPTQAGASA